MTIFPTSVNPEGLTMLINRLGRDCTPDQYVREFVQNSIEAINRVSGGKGEILLDFNRFLYETTGNWKISFTDNGDGMSPEQMMDLLNKLSASGHQNEYENYGMGAKIAALSRNKAGILYESWKDGMGYYCYLYYDEKDNKYGLKAIERDGNVLYVAPISDDIKPEIIDKHGTRVTLFGNTLESDTLSKPENVTGSADSWLVYYLNSRFFTFPAGINVSARIGYYRENPRHNYMASVIGQKATFEKFALHSGKIDISDAKVHWWILDKSRDGHGREYVLGHTATLHNNEILDKSDQRSSRAALFGVVLGPGDVVIYVEPDSTYVQKTSRTNLVKEDGSPLPWEKWADEFRKKMPRELKDYVDNIASKTEQKSHEEVIRERLKEIRSLLRVSKYRAVENGTKLAVKGESQDTIPGTSMPRQRTGPRLNRPPLSNNSTIDSLLHILSKEKGTPSEEVDYFALPKVTWISVKDGSRSIDEIEDRAAQFLKQDNNIKANRDFQAFTDLIQFICAKFPPSEVTEKIIADTCYEMFEQQLIEAVLGIQSMVNRPEWDPADIERAFSEEALTTAVMARYQVLQAAIKEANKRHN
jgi:hypothetical protein